jgi:hypothetical protein
LIWVRFPVGVQISMIMAKKIKRWEHLEDQLVKQEQDKKTFNKNLEDLVYNYPTKHKEGFTTDEQRALVSKFPNINMDKYWDAQMGITCMRDDETGQFIIYHCDVLTSLRCGIENRDITLAEWD